jgi:hypothetical protein
VGLLALALAVGGVASQDGGKDKDEKTKVKGMLPPGFKDLGLSKAQVLQVYTVQTNYKKKIADLQAKIADLKKEQTQEEFKVLTEAQREKYLKAKGIEVKEKKTEK